MGSRKMWMDSIMDTDAMLNKLQQDLVNERDDLCRDVQGLDELKVELRLVTTFVLCAREFTHFWFGIEHPRWCSQIWDFDYFLRRLDGALPLNSARAVSSCRDTLDDVKHQICEAHAEMLNSIWLSASLSRFRLVSLDYNTSFFKSNESYSMLLDDFLKSNSPRIDEFMKFLNSLLENVVDIIIWCEAWGPRFEILFQALQENLIFLKNFLLFARIKGMLDEKPGQLLKHSGAMALAAAHFCYVFCFFRNDSEVLDGMELRISVSLEKIKPVYHEVRSAYIDVLEFRSSSLTLSAKNDMLVVGDFVDSLIGSLWELLLNYPTSFMVSMKHQMKILYGGLRFLRNILKKQQETYDGLNVRIKDLIAAVVNNAGVMIFSLYEKGIEEALAMEIDVKIFLVLEKIKLIKAEVEEKHPLVLRLDISTTNTLQLVDLLLENLKELASGQVEPVSFAKNGLGFLRSYLKKALEHPEMCPLIVREDLSFLRSFTENNLEQINKSESLQLGTLVTDLVSLRSLLEINGERHSQHEELQALWSQVLEVAFKAEFVINSLAVGDISYYSLMLLDNVKGEIKVVKSEVQNAISISKLVTPQARSNSSTETSHQTSCETSNQVSNQISNEIKAVKTEPLEIDNENDIFKAPKATKIWRFCTFKFLHHFLKATGRESRGKKNMEIGDSEHVPEPQNVIKSSTEVPQNSISTEVPQNSVSVINEVVVDLKDQEKAITDQLIGGSNQLNIVSIVGMPGIGKTTLAQKVYSDFSVISHFHILAWCCISQVYCKKDLLLEILSCIDEKDEYSEMDVHDLANKLRQHLKRKRYLVVLDDVWESEAWDALRESFPDDINGSRILLTSRNHEVPGNPHFLRLLTEEEGWELLQKRLKVTRGEGYPPELNVLGRQIARNCSGLPLSIVILSGILATLDQDGWNKVAERLSSNSMVGATGQCKSVLELSYTHLPDHLKQCLLYFGSFREDEEIPIRKLTWLLVSEGFVQKNELESAEKKAEGYIMALINRSLVMVSRRRSSGGVKTCRIHDLLHVFCVGKAKDQNFLHVLQGCDEFLECDELQEPRRLSIYCQPKHFVKSRIFSPHLRSLLYSASGVRRREVSYNLTFIHQMKLLRVLDLGQISLGFTFPSELCLLIRLRHLTVLGRMKSIPSSLANLQNLETLIVTTYHSGGGLSLFQDALCNMEKLRHVHVHGALIDLIFVNDNLLSSSSLCKLDTFSTPKLYMGQSFVKMTRLFPNIRELKCCLLESEESTSYGKRIVAMDSLKQLESLKLLLGKVSGHHTELLLPLNLKRLTLEDFSWSVLPTIGKLTNLEVLKLVREADGDGIKDWDMEEEGFFPNLKVLKLKSLNMVTWRGSGDHFPCLEKLILEHCMELEELPSCLWETLTLQSIEVHGCLYSTGDLVRDIKEQQMEFGNKNLKILITGEIEETISWSDGDSD